MLNQDKPNVGKSFLFAICTSTAFIVLQYIVAVIIVYVMKTISDMPILRIVYNIFTFGRREGSLLPALTSFMPSLYFAYIIGDCIKRKVGTRTAILTNRIVSTILVIVGTITIVEQVLGKRFPYGGVCGIISAFLIWNSIKSDNKKETVEEHDNHSNPTETAKKEINKIKAQARKRRVGTSMPIIQPKENINIGFKSDQNPKDIVQLLDDCIAQIFVTERTELQDGDFWDDMSCHIQYAADNYKKRKINKEIEFDLAYDPIYVSLAAFMGLSKALLDVKIKSKIAKDSSRELMELSLWYLINKHVIPQKVVDTVKNKDFFTHKDLYYARESLKNIAVLTCLCEMKQQGLDTLVEKNILGIDSYTYLINIAMGLAYPNAEVITDDFLVDNYISTDINKQTNLEINWGYRITAAACVSTADIQRKEFYYAHVDEIGLTRVFKRSINVMSIFEGNKELIDFFKLEMKKYI